MSGVTQQLLEQYREITQYGSHLGIGGKALSELLDHISALRSELAAANKRVEEFEEFRETVEMYGVPDDPAKTLWELRKMAAAMKEQP
jgi:hypothetical protein